MEKLLRLHRRIALQGAACPQEWLLFLLLWPFSVLYGLIGLLRNRFYNWQIMHSFKSAVPVVSVGNLAAGGTGKTPVVDWLLKEFTAQGNTPAVVSRGYGGCFAGEVGVVCKGGGPLLDAVEAGDEPYLLARRNPQVIALIARKRAAGVQVAVEQFKADVVILDDGFQHRAVQRTLDLVLLDATHPCGNRWPLPAGLLREFPSALKRADLLLLTRAGKGASFRYADKPVFTCRHQLADYAVDINGRQVDLRDLQGLKLCAFAGIADPVTFFDSLRRAGLQLSECLSLGDHCRYDTKTLQRIQSAISGCDALLTTEKDAVKLTAKMFPVPCYQVPMTIVVDAEESFRAQLLNKLWSNK